MWNGVCTQAEHRDYTRSLQHNCACVVLTTSQKCQVRKQHVVVQPLCVWKTTFENAPLFKRHFPYMHNIRTNPPLWADNENAPEVCTCSTSLWLYTCSMICMHSPQEPFLEHSVIWQRLALPWELFQEHSSGCSRLEQSVAMHHFINSLCSVIMYASSRATCLAWFPGGKQSLWEHEKISQCFHILFNIIKR